MKAMRAAQIADMSICLHSYLIFAVQSYWHRPTQHRDVTEILLLQVYMLNGTTVASQDCPNPQDPNSGAGCAGYGTQPYVTSVSNPLNYGAKVMYDPIKNLYYFIGMAVEWLDR